MCLCDAALVCCLLKGFSCVWAARVPHRHRKCSAASHHAPGIGHCLGRSRSGPASQALGRALIDDLGGGAQALSEVEFLAFCRRHGFPRPELQVRLDTRGRRRYLDATFRAPCGRIVRVEIDGGVHLTVSQRWRDTRNDNDAIIDGELVLRFASFAIYTNDRTAVAQLRRALGLVSG